MKKLLLTLTSVTLCLTLVACGGEETAPQASAPDTTASNPAPTENPVGDEGETMERPQMMDGERVEGGEMMQMLPEGVELPEDFDTLSQEERETVLAELGIDMEEMMENRGDRTENMERPEGMELPEGMERPEMMEGERVEGGQMMQMLPEGVELPEDFDTMTEEERQAVLEELGIDMEAIMAEMMANRGENMERPEGMERPTT